MSNDNARAGFVRPQETADARTRVAQECFFTARPEPLEAWIWKAKVPASAERVFWLHWREGLRNRDWCSSVPISQVASRCQLDESTVTRAYQVLARHGLLRRTDPGRDPRNPFSQATAVTEVFVPRELAQNWNALPKRTRSATSSPSPVVTPPASLPSAEGAPAPQEAKPHISWKERRKEMAAWESAMSAQELARYRDALYRRLPNMPFDVETKVAEDTQLGIQSWLRSLATPAPSKQNAVPSAVPIATCKGPRKLTLFEVARLRRELQRSSGATDVSEMTRQVLWAVEQGALLKLPSAMAVNVALKKIREGAWTRPHRMPPNWARSIATPEPCGTA